MPCSLAQAKLAQDARAAVFGGPSVFLPAPCLSLCSSRAPSSAQAERPLEAKARAQVGDLRLPELTHREAIRAVLDTGKGLESGSFASERKLCLRTPEAALSRLEGD